MDHPPDMLPPTDNILASQKRYTIYIFRITPATMTLEPPTLETTLVNYTNFISYSSVRTSYFANRVISVWNTLPTDRIDFTSFAAFKRTIQ